MYQLKLLKASSKPNEIASLLFAIIPYTLGLEHGYILLSAPTVDYTVLVPGADFPVDAYGSLSEDDFTPRIQAVHPNFAPDLSRDTVLQPAIGGNIICFNDNKVFVNGDDGEYFMFVAIKKDYFDAFLSTWFFRVDELHVPFGVVDDSNFEDEFPLHGLMNNYSTFFVATANLDFSSFQKQEGIYTLHAGPHLSLLYGVRVN